MGPDTSIDRVLVAKTPSLEHLWSPFADQLHTAAVADELDELC